MSNNIGKRLRDLRGNKTMEEVANELNITRQAIYNYENNIRVPKDEIKIKISEYYNKSVQEIFFD